MGKSNESTYKFNIYLSQIIEILKEVKISFPVQLFQLDKRGGAYYKIESFDELVEMSEKHNSNIINMGNDVHELFPVINCSNKTEIEFTETELKQFVSPERMANDMRPYRTNSLTPEELTEIVKYKFRNVLA